MRMFYIVFFICLALAGYRYEQVFKTVLAEDVISGYRYR